MAVVERVMVVDDHQVFGDLVSMALETVPSWMCVGTANSVASARELADRERPDLALIDVRLPDGDGLDLAAELLASRPTMRVLMLTAYPSAALVARARRVGVSGLLGKELPLPELLAALSHATPEEPALADVATDDWGLTRREVQVLELLGEGCDAREIARELNISVYTTRDHVKNLLAKLGARSQLDAVVVAARAGILRLGVM